MIQVKVVSLENCEATPPTLSLIKEIAQEMGIPINLIHIIARTPEDANEHRLIGSPTVQINGLDIEPEARRIEQFGLT